MKEVNGTINLRCNLASLAEWHIKLPHNLNCEICFSQRQEHSNSFKKDFFFTKTDVSLLRKRTEVSENNRNECIKKYINELCELSRSSWMPGAHQAALSFSFVHWRGSWVEIRTGRSLTITITGKTDST